MRHGIGYDIHRIKHSDDPKALIPIGGLGIASPFSIVSHSDGDVLLHALTDACLGALALGDIGQWFPDNATENKGRESSEFVKEVMKEVNRLGWRVSQCDSIVLLEKPKLSPHILRIRENLVTLLEVELECVSVKAKSGEGLPPIGTSEAIAAHASVTLVKRDGQ